MRPEGQIAAQLHTPVFPLRKDNELRIILPAKEKSVRHCLDNVKAGLSDMNLRPEEWSSLEITLAEILNNIVEHAYAGRSDGLIELSLTRSHDGLWFSVVDHGAPMPNGEPPLGQRVNIDCPIADLPEGGFGWFLIRELAHDMVYERIDGRNELRFRMAIGR